MRLLIPLLLLPLLCPPRAAAAPAKADCSKSSDACYAGRRLSPFMEAVKAVEAAADTKAAAPAAAPAPAEKRPAARPAAPASARESRVSTAAVPAAAPAEEAAPSPAVEGALSHPAWLLFIAGALAGLYFYLRAPARRKGGRR